MFKLRFISAVGFFFLAPLCLAEQVSTEVDTGALVRVNIDTVSLDMKNLDHSLLRFEQTLHNFSQAVLLATSDNSSLTPQDQQHLQQAIQDLHKSSSAMTAILQSMPGQVEQFNQRLPDIVNKFQLSLGELVTALQAIQTGLVHFATQAPSIIEQAEDSFGQAVNTLSWKLTLTLLVMVAVLVIILVGSIWSLNKYVIQPFMRAVTIMNSIPEKQLKTAELLNEISHQLSSLRLTIPTGSEQKVLLADQPEVISSSRDSSN